MTPPPITETLPEIPELTAEQARGIKSHFEKLRYSESEQKAAKAIVEGIQRNAQLGFETFRYGGGITGGWLSKEMKESLKQRGFAVVEMFKPEPFMDMPTVLSHSYISWGDPPEKIEITEFMKLEGWVPTWREAHNKSVEQVEKSQKPAKPLPPPPEEKPARPTAYDSEASRATRSGCFPLLLALASPAAIFLLWA